MRYFSLVAPFLLGRGLGGWFAPSFPSLRAAAKQSGAVAGHPEAGGISRDRPATPPQIATSQAPRNDGVALAMRTKVLYHCGTVQPVFYEELRAKRLLHRLQTPGWTFRWAANPYRGGQHPCAYCYVRGDHRYRGHAGGERFEQRLGVKRNAAAVLQEEIHRPRWAGEPLAIGTLCDPYAPAEVTYKLTQGLLGVLLARGQPAVIFTKSSLIIRDLPLLQALAQRGLVQVVFSLATLDLEVWRHVEPEAAQPERRIQALGRLVAAGVPAGIVLGPLLPDYTDAPGNLEALVRAASDNGARFLAANVPQLRVGSKDWYMPALRELHPHMPPQYARYYRGPFDPSRYTEELLAVIAGLRRRYELPDQPGGAWLAQALPGGQMTLAL